MANEIPLNEQVYRRDSPLHYDIKSGERRFYNDTHQVNKKSLKKSDKLGEKPLHVAAEMGDLEYCKFILQQYPAAFYLTNKSGKLAVDVAQFRRQRQTYYYLLKWEVTNYIRDNNRHIRDQYSSSEILHTGNFGEIRKFQLKSNQFIAVKKINRVREFEARHLEQLDSPYVVKSLGYFQEADTNIGESSVFVFMEIISGSTLTEKIEAAQKAKREMSEKLKREFMKQILCGLVDLKCKGIVHRDLKSDNIMVNGSNIKILDFGSSLSTTSTSRSDYERTRQYMAPEVMQGEQATDKADVFSAGVIFFELCTGRLRNINKDSIDSMKMEIRQKDDVNGWKADLFDSAICEKRKDRCGAEELLRKPYLRETDRDAVDRRNCNFFNRVFVEVEFAVILCPDAYHLACKDCITKFKDSGKSQPDLYKKCEMNDYICSNALCHYVCPICMTVSHMTYKENLLLPVESSLIRLENLENIILLVLDTIIPIIITLNEKLDVHEKNANVAKLVGGLLSIAGAILIPFKAGVSTPLMIAGGAVAVPGSAVFLGTIRMDAILKKLSKDDIDDYMSMLMHAYKILQERYERNQLIYEFHEEPQVGTPGPAFTASMRAAGQAGNIAGAAPGAADGTRAALATTSLVLNIVGSVVSGITIFSDIFFFVSAARIMFKGEKSEFRQDLKATENFLLDKRQELGTHVEFGRARRHTGRRR